MSEQMTKPVIFLAFANDRQQSGQYLRNLAQEAARLRKALEPAETAGLCELVERQGVTAEQILAVFQKHQDRLVVFHYAGHADDYELLLETATGGQAPADVRGLAAFLRQQKGLQLVFLNACSTRVQANDLRAAGVPVVVATSRAVDDEVAAGFAVSFYNSLAAGNSISTAFAKATGALQFTIPDLPRHLRPVADPYQEHTADGCPWERYVRSGADLALDWSLPQAAGNPLWDLPPLPELDLPTDSPYRHLQWYTREQAELFFGRGQEIRNLYRYATDPSSVPIILLYGQSGVGKSSLLDAGLRPRLECKHEVCYLHRDQGRGLTGTLGQSLEHDGVVTWQDWETAARPLTVILDQVEETFTRPNQNLPNELADFILALQNIFGNPARRPHGKLILGFRKEYLAEIEKQLRSHALPFNKVFLDRLDRAGIIEAVAGPARSLRLSRQYGLMVDDDLPGLIADDLLTDPGSPVATVLQILLCKLWDRASSTSQSKPHFTRTMYGEIRRQGIALDDFLAEQLQELWAWQKDVVDSGLELDLLAFHTTPWGSTDQRMGQELQDTYSHYPNLPTLVQKNKDVYLLADVAGDQAGPTGATRLAHDTLVPLVRRRFDESDAPGQRARRILENRGVDWQADKEGPPLDEADLTLVEAGKEGMRTWTEDEKRLVEASQRARDRRHRNRYILYGLGIFALALIVTAAMVAFRQAGVANSAKATAEAQRVEADQAKGTAQAESTRALAAESTAEARRQEAEREARRSLTRDLASRSQLALGKDAELGLLLAREAARISFQTDGYLAREVEEALYLALSSPYRGRSSHRPDPNQRPVSFDYEAMAEFWEKTGLQRESEYFNARGDDLMASVDPISNISFNAGKTKAVTVECPSSSWEIRETKIYCASQVARLRSVETGEILSELSSQAGNIAFASFSGNGLRIVTVSDDGQLRVFDERGVQLASIKGAATDVIAAEVSSDDSQVITESSSGIARVWQLPNDTGPVIKTEVPMFAVEFTDAGRVLVAVSTWRPTPFGWCTDGTSLAPFKGYAHGEISSLVSTPDHGRILVVLLRNTPIMWRAEGTAEGIEGPWSYSAIRWASPSHDGAHIVVGSDQGEVGVADVMQHQWLVPWIPAHQGSVRTAAFDPDDRLIVTAGADGAIGVWDATNGNVVRVISNAHAGQVNAAWFAADGSLIVSGGEDGSAKVWNAATGQLLRVLEEHPEPVNWVQVSPGGVQTATVSSDGMVRLWNVTNGARLAVFQACASCSANYIAFSPDGNRLASTGDDKTIRQWRIWGNSAEALAEVDRRTGREFTDEERRQYGLD
ncbi:MAG: hypothetical protein BroJett011_27350 [Chloroflexota bacterium]|nr:MAG: hypothetical protein BroJett011_27350 [Chloroflexota bacterium]